MAIPDSFLPEETSKPDPDPNAKSSGRIDMRAFRQPVFTPVDEIEPERTLRSVLDAMGITDIVFTDVMRHLRVPESHEVNILQMLASNWTFKTMSTVTTYFQSLRSVLEYIVGKNGQDLLAPLPAKKTEPTLPTSTFVDAGLTSAEIATKAASEAVADSQRRIAALLAPKPDEKHQVAEPGRSSVRTNLGDVGIDPKIVPDF